MEKSVEKTVKEQGKYKKRIIKFKKGIAILCNMIYD